MTSQKKKNLSNASSVSHEKKVNLKRKPVEEYKKTEWINFTISGQEKQEWMQYADSVGFPLARVIKEAMNKIIFKDSQVNKVEKEPVNPLLIEIQNIQEKLKELNEKYMTSIETYPMPKSTVNDEILKQQISDFIEDFGPMKRTKIEHHLKIDPIILRKILVEMQKNGTILFLPNTQEWRLP